jgi:hypothetical protein
MGMPANPDINRLARLPKQFLNPSAQPQPAQELPNQGGGMAVGLYAPVPPEIKVAGR